MAVARCVFGLNRGNFSAITKFIGTADRPAWRAVSLSLSFSLSLICLFALLFFLLFLSFFFLFLFFFLFHCDLARYPVPARSAEE